MQKAGTVTDSDMVQQAMAQVFPFRSALGDEITLGGMEDYGCNNQFVTAAYVDVIHDGKPVVVGVAK